MNDLTNATSLANPAALDEPQSGIDRLFSKLSAFYGSKFADLWRGCDLAEVKATWREELIGMSRDELLAGIAGCKTRDWPPTLPEFVKLCRPDQTEALFSKAQRLVYQSAAERDYGGNSVLYWAIQRFGEHDLKTATGVSGQRWKQIVSDAMDENRRGMLPIIPERREALPSPGQTSISREEAAERVKSLGMSLNPRGDKYWAVKLEARHKAGEKLAPIHISAYREALGLKSAA